MDEARRKQLELLAGGGTQPTDTPTSGGLPPEIEALIRSAPGTPGGLKTMSARGGTIDPGKSASMVQNEMRQKLLMDLAAQNIKGGQNNPDARRIVSQAKAARAQIGQIWDEADKLIPATESSGTKAIAGGLANRVGTAVGLNEPARAFRQTLKAKLRNVARSLGERGVITDKDIEDFVSSMPDFTDSTVSRPIKKENLLGGVDALVNAFTQKTYGVPFTPEPSDPHVDALQQQFPGAKITKVK